MSQLKPHGYGSFSYKVTNDNIKQILTQRSTLSNVVQIGMPFVKATTTVAIDEYLGEGNIGFTLGIHAMPDIGYRNLFENTGSPEKPFIGYTYKADGTNVPVYADMEKSTSTLIGQYLQQQKTIQDIPPATIRIPPPGITSLKIGRNRSGLSAAAEISIAVPSLQQLEYLNRVFLIPGCGMVVEWGQQLAPTESTSLLMREQMFPWYNRTALTGMLDLLGRRKFGLESILRDYVYPTQGQYMWMFGRIANIQTKGNMDGSFDVTVSLRGPSEDQWAYSVRQTVLPPVQENQAPCLDNVNSIETYLITTSTGNNLKTLLDGVVTDASNKNVTISALSDWAGHVVKIDNGNKKEGTQGTDSNPNTNQTSFADVDNAYYITWRFFVNVVLNDINYGIKSIFAKASLPDETLEKIRVIRPYAGNVQQVPIDDPNENYVGANPYLRSFDPGTMIIVNQYAADAAYIDYNNGPSAARDVAQKIKTQSERFAKEKFASIGGEGVFDFLNSDPTPTTNKKEDTDRGLLSTGVWLNHKAVITALLSADTLLQGISNLLNKMNYATRGYWNLTLDPSEPVAENDTFDYIVVDQNYKGSSDQAVNELLDENKIYTFNKFLRNTPNGIVGSELTDFNVDLDLPKLLFSQIATMGLNQPGDAEKASSESTKVWQCKHGIISDANDTLREMFGVSTISAKPGFKSIDLTNINTQKELGACASTVSQPTAGTGGRGAQGAPLTSPGENTANASVGRLEFLRDEAKEVLEENELCTKCKPCWEGAGSVPVQNVGAVSPTMKGSTSPYANGGNAKVPLSALTPINGSGPYSVARSGAPPSSKKLLGDVNADTRYQGKQWLEKEAAAQFQKLLAHAVATRAPRFTISSAYRDIDHQTYLAEKSTGKGVANPGSSPHGMGRAIDISELFAAANNGSTSGPVNARVRETNQLYKWLAFNAPAFGWYNPKRLADNNGVDECWHWEYWGYEIPPTNTPPARDVLAPLSRAEAIRTDRPPLSQRPKCSDALLREVGLIGFDIFLNEDEKMNRGWQTCQEAKIRCAKATDQLQQSELLLQENSVYDNALQSAIRDFPNLNVTLWYIEILPEQMTAKIRCSADGKKSNAFGASPGTLSIKAELTLPGIAGLRVGELFWVDKIPSYYKMFGAFQIMSIEDVVNNDGWQTKISAVFNYLGEAWKTSMLRVLESENVIINPF